jgi:hypothetical protein
MFALYLTSNFHGYLLRLNNIPPGEREYSTNLLWLKAKLTILYFNMLNFVFPATVLDGVEMSSSFALSHCILPALLCCFSK